MSKNKNLPLLPQQERLVKYEIIKESKGSQNAGIALELKGNIDFDRLDRSLAQLTKYHDAFYMNFKITKDNTIEHKMNDFHIQWVKHDFTDVCASDKEKVVLKEAQKEVLRVIDIFNKPLFEFHLYKISSDWVVLLIKASHIIVDGPSFTAIYAQLAQLYLGMEHIETPFRWEDFILQENAYYKSQSGGKSKVYWNNKIIPDSIGRTELDKLDYRLIKFEGNKIPMEKIKILARQEKTSVFNIILFVYNKAISEIFNRDNCAVTYTMTNRFQESMRYMVGLTTHNLPYILTDINRKDLSQLMAETKKQLSDNFHHFVMGECVNSPLFTLSYLSETVKLPSWGDLKVTQHPFNGNQKYSDLTYTLICNERKNFVELSVNTDRSIYRKEFDYQLFQYMKKILNELTGES